MDANRPVSYDMSYYFGMLRRHWWIIALFTVIGVAGALGIADTQPKVYESTTSVLVTPTSTANSTVVGARTNGVINLDTEAQLVTSAEVATGAAKLLKITTNPDALSSAVSVNVPPNTTVLAITFDGSTPRTAQVGSHAFATAYLDNRQNSAQADLTRQTNALTAKIKQQIDALTKINNDLAGLRQGSAKYANAQSQRTTLTSQINQLTNRLNNLSTTTVTSGKIITDADLPTRPTRPSVPLFLTSGAMVGILLGIAFTVLRQRADKRVRSAADVTRRSGLPLLAQLPVRVKPRFDDVFPPHGTGGRTFNRLRNEILATLRPNDQVIMVTGASGGSASSLVSANLASALARAGSEVVLVCAHLPESLAEAAPVVGLLGVAGTPGLSDVLAGKVPLDTAVQRAPRNPWLRVITTGGTASATGFLQSQTLRDILTQLRTRAEYVVIEAPSTANTADAQSLASLSDATIIVVELRRTTHLEVLDAADQLRRVGTTMLGSVILPQLKRGTDDEPAPSGRQSATPVAPAQGPYIEAQPTAPIQFTRSDPYPGTDATVTGGRFVDSLVSGATPASHPTADHQIAEPPVTGPSSNGDRPTVDRHTDLRVNGNPRNGDQRSETVAALAVTEVTEVAEVAMPGSAGAGWSTAGSTDGGSVSVFNPANNGHPRSRDDETTSTGLRRRILPGRRGQPRGQSGRRPSPVRPSSDPTISFDMPPAGGTSGPAGGGGRTTDPLAARPAMESPSIRPAVEQAQSAQLTMDVPVLVEPRLGPLTDTLPGRATDGPASAPRTPSQGRTGTLSNITLPSVGRETTPINPTSITGPVLGAKSIVISRPTGSAVPDPVATDPNGAGPVATDPTVADPIATDPMVADPNGADPNGADPIATDPTVVTPGGPRLGANDQTASFPRIDLVYVEDGAGDGTAR